MARETVAIGPTGRRLAANIFALRKARGLNQPQLARRLQEQGRAVHATVVSKIEGLDRRVDVDDLVVLAVALGVTPNRLLLDAKAQDEIELTPAIAVHGIEAWQWARGSRPLTRDLELAAADGDEAKVERWQQFVRENAPVRGDVDWDPHAFTSYGDRQALAQSVLGTLMTALKAGLKPDALQQLTATAIAVVNGHAGSEATAQQPIVAAIVTSAKGVLITARKDGKPPWGFVTGEVEPGEQPADAAVREVKEETGLEVRLVLGPPLGERDHPATGRHMIYMAARPVRGTTVAVGDEAELAEVRWVTLDEAEELMPDMYGPVRDYLARTLRTGDR